MKLRYHVVSNVIILLLIALLLVLPLFLPGFEKFRSPEYNRDFILSYGKYSMIVYVALVSASVPLPVPSTPVVIAGGYVFGTRLGFILTSVAIIVGSTFAFLIARYAGRPVVAKLADVAQLDHLYIIFKKHRTTALLLSYAIPIFPSDLVSFFLGLTRMHYSTFLFFLIIGHIPRLLIVTSIGSGLHEGFTAQTIVASVFGVVFVLVSVFRRYLRRLMFKELRFLKKEAGIWQKLIVR